MHSGSHDHNHNNKYPCLLVTPLFIATLRMYKHNVVYTYHGILFSFKKESKPGTKGQVLYDSTHVRYFGSQIHRDRKENGGPQGLKGWMNRNLFFNGCVIFIWKMKQILEMDNGCTTM